MDENIPGQDCQEESSVSFSEQEEIPSIEEAFQCLKKFRTFFEDRFECTKEDVQTLQNFYDRTLDMFE